MFSFKDMPPSAASLFAAYASFATSMMMIRSITNDLLPPKLISFISSIFNYFFTLKSSPQTTLVIKNKTNYAKNQVFDAAEIYLRTKISPSMDRLAASKTPRQHRVSLSMDKDQEIVDQFQDIHLKWRFVAEKTKEDRQHIEEKRHYELSFHKKFMDKVVDFYLPYILRRAKEIKAMENVSKLCSQNLSYSDDFGDERCRGNWGSIGLEHPATFDTLAMDPDLKKMIIDDLDRFLKRKEFYRKVGKAWKRGYLLYGPPGTGKSSLIAAMANYLKFDIYDLDLTDICSNSELRRSLLSTSNRSILVIEDIDCSVNLQNRANSDDESENNDDYRSKLTLSGMLNFMDGLWSSCGDERIIVLTTNHKDRLDPALLRPGRMDVHIYLSYCTSKAFEALTTNYLGGGAIHHPLYEEIKALIEYANVTPAEVAEELMKDDDIDIVMEGLAKFVKLKREEQNGGNKAPEKEGNEMEVVGGRRRRKWESTKNHGEESNREF
ncbi:AAA-ATPase At2g18193-like [Cucurbita moschata]|uniref:AAA-ATPase At2g18193-like n=1 Tax=Cucurbita moschata TaxID=3662 RepID=A0A6J1HFX6_CUCMO|nr:AAA-ATPase At2g18193-like [Cucurbita moschata]